MVTDLLAHGPLRAVLSWMLSVLGFSLGSGLIGFALWLVFRPRERAVLARLGGLTWTRGEFCRGWLITGDTGSGKTSSGINQLCHQLFQNVPDWGGLCIDEKGVYWESLAAMAQHYDREHHLIQLEIGDRPRHRFNLTGDRSIPFSTYAKFVVDTATSLGQGGDKGFFKTQSQSHIAKALELLWELDLPVTLARAYELLTDTNALQGALEELGGRFVTPPREALIAHFVFRLLKQPPEQLGGVRETVANHLQHFLAPEVAAVFSPEGQSTFQFQDIDQGGIILLTLPQRFQTERRYVGTFLKLLFYQHALRRFDLAAGERAGKNLLILWADEAQRFMTASEDGTSDYNCVDVIREAGATIVAATQSTTSFIPPLGADKSKVLTLNLRNRLIFRSADEADAVQSADFLGRHRVVKRSWGFNGGKRSVNYSEAEEHRLKPHTLRTLRDHEAILVHCERGFRRRVLPPLGPQGKVPEWYRAKRWRFFL